MNFGGSLENLRQELVHQYSDVQNVIRCTREKRDNLMKRIEDVVLELTKALARGESPHFVSINFGKFDNCCYNRRLQLKKSDQCKERKISFGRIKSRPRFAALVFLLSKIHKLSVSFQSSTKRELYYGNLDIFKSQSELDVALRDICYILNAPPWELGITSSAKGVVAGPLIFKSSDGLLTNCDKPGGVLIPHNILDVQFISTTAQWALIVEKDAAFQKILDCNGLTKMKECLFITGKGFPDINTRLLVCRLWETFKIPILALVDADPYGLEIMCTYRFGSLASSPFSDRLACPPVRWLGVHPSDIKLLGMDFTDLSLKDVRKISSLADRPYIKDNEKLKKEVQILLDQKIKAEIEAVTNISTNYITDVYIPGKIHCKEYF